MRSSPCKDCPERFPACSAHCPKDARGEYGYKAWRAELNIQKEAAKLQRDIDYIAFCKNRSDWYKRR